MNTNDNTGNNQGPAMGNAGGQGANTQAKAGKKGKKQVKEKVGFDNPSRASPVSPSFLPLPPSLFLYLLPLPLLISPYAYPPTYLPS